MTRTELDQLMAGLAPAIAAAIRGETAALEQRIAALEQRKYVGTFSRVTGAKAGQTATHNGCLWFCAHDTTDAPPGPAWVLMHKSNHT